MEAAALNRLAVESAIQDYRDTHRLGFQQVEKPQFIFTTKNNKFSFAVGGYINLRAGYDFDGGVNNIDFIPYDIPMQETYANRQKLMMDATTSRIYLKAVTNSNKLGRIVVFIDADFRGGSENSYTPRVRSAYVSLGGFTFGRDVTTFCDLLAAPQTIDFQGPNAYNFNFATMIRYQFSVWKDVFQMGMAAELPNVSGTYGPNFAPIPQRVPDFPVYLQLSWGRNRSSHIRASAVFRDIYMHNTRTGNNTSYFGWGVQGSGHIRSGRPRGTGSRRCSTTATGRWGWPCCSLRGCWPSTISSTTSTTPSCASAAAAVRAARPPHSSSFSSRSW